MLNKLFFLWFFLFFCGIAASLAGFRQLSSYIFWINIPIFILHSILRFQAVWRKNKEIFGLDEKENTSAAENEQIKTDTPSKP